MSAGEKPTPAKPAKPTRYEISRGVDWTLPGETDQALAALEESTTIAWLPVATVEASSAPAALRQWADSQGDKFGGGPLRAVPVGNIKQVDAKLETTRTLTLA